MSAADSDENANGMDAKSDAEARDDSELGNDDAPGNDDDPAPGDSDDPGEPGPNTDGESDPDATVPVETPEMTSPGAVEQPLRRLSHFEYRNTIGDLFPDIDVSIPQLATEETIDGFSNHWDTMQPSGLLSEQYFDAAFALAQLLDANTIQTLTDCSEAACAASFISEFGSRVFRRPLTEEEVRQFSDLFDAGVGASDFVLGVQLTVMAMLQSPHFLYRVEFGTGDATDERGKPLAPYETATRLSYLFWASMPDDGLSDAAASGGLDDASEIEEQARRLLADPRARDGVMQFFKEWLKMDKVERALKLPEDGWDEAFRAELMESAARFAYDEVFASGGTGRDLLTNTTFPVTQRVAALMGESVSDEGWSTLSTDPAERAGFLTHPAFLGAHGYGEYGSPVLRGVYVMDRVLCSPPSPPPGDVNIILPESAAEAPEPRTNREAYEQVTSGATCQGCHVAINGFGFAFEHYDTLGRFRTRDSGFDVDASGSIAGFDFDDGVGLAQQLAESERYRDCVVKKWATYALGGSPLASDERFLLDLVEAAEANDFELRELLVSLATHERYSSWLATTEVMQ